MRGMFEGGGVSLDFLSKNGYKKFDIVEALSRAISSVTVFYIQSDPVLAKIQSDFEKLVPSIPENNIHKKKFNLAEVVKDYEPLSMDDINLNIVKAGSEFHYFHFNYHSIRYPTISSSFSPGCCNLQCIDNLMKELKCDVSSENPEIKNVFIKMVIIGEIVMLLDELIDEFWFYKTNYFSFKDDTGKIFQLCIELTDTDLKTFLQDWKTKLKTTTLEQANLFLTEEDQQFSYLVRSLTFILESLALPFIPEIAKCQFSCPEILSDKLSLDKSCSSSWIYETFGSRKITHSDENGAIIDQVNFKKEDGAMQINQQLEVLSPFREKIESVSRLADISRFPVYAIRLPDKPDGFSESVFSSIKKLNQILLGSRLLLAKLLN